MAEKVGIWRLLKSSRLADLEMKVSSVLEVHMGITMPSKVQHVTQWVESSLLGNAQLKSECAALRSMLICWTSTSEMRNGNPFSPIATSVGISTRMRRV